MLLTARPLTDVQGVNTFRPDTQLSWTAGDTVDLYFQLVDASLDLSNQGFLPPGRRYMPAAGATLSCVVENIDNAKKVTRFATQPYATDGSIWKLALTSADTNITGTPQLRLTLTEGTKVTHGLLKLGLKVWPSSNV
jgi:hypothetical protein